ncbi:MAG TPA: TetR/AcrR family transcriptional regulator [Gaiellales bacterium]|nr:TetR/AcrR family transcriptional regulator [Gaiellales bacterium]
MADAVKPTRRYESPRRREQAEATRREILDAAERLFLRDGYAATTMAAIAAEARVSLRTVYVAFETKAGVLRALWNHRLRSDQPGVPMTQHPDVLAALDQRDPEQMLRMNARNSALGKLRIGHLAVVIRTAAPIDPEIAELHDRIDQQYRALQGQFVERLHRRRALKKGLGVERGTDILWVINHPDTWQLYVDRGWTPEEYERWAGNAAVRELLR